MLPKGARYLYIITPLSAHLSMDTHLFLYIRIVNNAVINTGMQMPLCDGNLFPLGIYPERGLVGHVVAPFLTSLGTSILFPTVAAPTLHPEDCTMASISLLPRQYLQFCFCYQSHPNWCDAVPLWF